MPTDKEMMEYLRQGLEKGIPREQLMDTLKLATARKETYPFPQPEKPVNTGFVQVGPGRVNYVGTGTNVNDIQSAGAAGLSYGRFAAENVVPLATMEFGGSLIPRTLVKARPVIGTALKVAGRALGYGAGSEAVAPLEGERPSLSRGLRSARNIALLEGAIRAPAYAFGRAGGVEPAAAALAQENPKLLTKTKPEDYAAAAKGIAETPTPQTPEHFGYNMLVRAKGEINGQKYVDAIRRTIRTNAAEKGVRVTERSAADLADRLQAALDKNGKISAEALDDWLRTNLSEPAAQVYEKGAGTAWKERLAGLRDKLVPQLYKDVGGSAAEFQAAASEKIGKVTAAKSILPEATETKMNLQTPGYLRQVLRDSDLGYQIRTRLAGLDEVAGSQNLRRVEDLAMRDSWTAAEKAEVEDILANIPAISYERVGMIRAGARKAGRGLTRAVRPTSRIAVVSGAVRGTSQ